MAHLKVENLSISFGGLKALSGVTFAVNKGEIYSIIGPNGAGKTTVFNCISGIYKPNRRKIFFKDREITPLKPHQVAQAGIARTFQNIELFAHMTTMDNLMLGRHTKLKTGLWAGSHFPDAQIEGGPGGDSDTGRKVEEIIDFLELQAARNQLVMNLPYGTQKLVELGRALALEPEVLVLG